MLLEFEVVNQKIFSTHFGTCSEKKSDGEQFPHCGFHSSSVHDKRTRKLRDLSVLNKLLFLLVYINRYRCQNCGEVFSTSFEFIASHQHYYT